MPSIDPIRPGWRPAVDFMRRLRGWLLAQNPLRAVSTILADGRPIYRVPSETHPGISYDVFFDEDGVMVCVCSDFAARHSLCKHCVEVLYRFYPESAPDTPTGAELARLGPSEMYANARRFRREPYIYSEGPAESTRRDQAIACEGARIESLLLDLASVLNARFPQSGAHRHALAAGDRVAALVLRDYHRKSLRAVPALLAPLVEAGAIAFAPCKSTLVKYAQDEQTLAYLREAYLLSTAPFVLMEQDVIIDASGISPFHFESYRAVKYGGHISPETKWFRMHVAVGRITHAILGFDLTPSTGDGTGDSSRMSAVLDSVEATGVQMRYVIGDNGYLHKEQILDVARRGARLVAPLKGRNRKAAGAAKDDILMVAMFAGSQPDLYDELTRARQAIEGVFSMEKRHSNRLASIGTKEERARALTAAGSPLFRARLCEFYARMIRHNLTRINMEEHKRNRHIWFSKGSVFSHVREVIAEDVA